MVCSQNVCVLSGLQPCVRLPRFRPDRVTLLLRSDAGRHLAPLPGQAQRGMAVATAMPMAGRDHTMLLCSSGRLVGCGGKAERTCDLPEHEQGMVFCQVVAAASCRAVSLGWLSVGVWKEELRLRPGRAPERSCAGTARRSHVAAAVQRARAALHGSCTGLGSHSFDRWGLALSSKLPWIRRGARKLHPQALVVNDKSGHPHSGVQRGHPIMHARFLPYPPPSEEANSVLVGERFIQRRRISSRKRRQPQVPRRHASPHPE